MHARPRRLERSITAWLAVMALLGQVLMAVPRPTGGIGGIGVLDGLGALCGAEDPAGKAPAHPGDACPLHCLLCRIVQHGPAPLPGLAALRPPGETGREGALALVRGGIVPNRPEVPPHPTAPPAA